MVAVCKQALRHLAEQNSTRLPKIHIEPENHRLESMMFLFQGCIPSFHVIFLGVWLVKAMEHLQIDRMVFCWFGCMRIHRIHGAKLGLFVKCPPKAKLYLKKISFLEGKIRIAWCFPDFEIHQFYPIPMLCYRSLFEVLKSHHTSWSYRVAVFFCTCPVIATSWHRPYKINPAQILGFAFGITFTSPKTPNWSIQLQNVPNFNLA